MKGMLQLIMVAAFAALLAGCGASSDPGPLAGTWRMAGHVPMTVSFRKGETEALGIIEKVSYEIRGNDVLVTYKEGISKGMTMRYTMTGADSARTDVGRLHRLQ